MDSILFVGGLDAAVTREVLLGAFAVFGEVISVEIPIDIQTLESRGFGFVEFTESDDAREAIDNMDASELFGRIIRVKMSNKRPTGQLKDPRKAVWADEIYYRKVSAQPLGEQMDVQSQ
jgi:peptidyl-prolyl isomerase E (cyclophilin E)